MTSLLLTNISRYLREVGFPDNVLEARVDRISAYKSLYTYNQLEQSMSQDESLNVSLFVGDDMRGRERGGTVYG